MRRTLIDKTSMWTEIKDETDIKYLLELYGYFHDSCLRDIYITTREFVDEKLAMHFDNKLTASLLFQRQFGPTTVLELKFEEIEQFNFRPFDTNTDPVIYDVTLMKSEGLFYWADFAGWEVGDNDSIWIKGKKLFWRLRPELIGNIERLKDE
ncbi:hypothetical protein [Flavobacterium sp.]|uniref:hypothetical protein n=1 Tax=Flavobacterium sp. TaxID=239 RepID=UPI001B77BA59|nr:hypothetical protein [Flavobacterium sp.]MBP6127739.1 hypothetical protein [Flavobacterium sp.]